jgi:endonuclease-3
MMAASRAAKPVSDKASDKKRKDRVIRGIKNAYPDVECALTYKDPLQLVIATVLSAQCTDARVNLVTVELFKKYHSAVDYAAAPREQIESDIRSTGFFRNKAKSIQGLCEALLRDHQGIVPSSMEELVALPGVGRKTANVVLSEGFGKAAGIVVDTHVHRLSRRLGLTQHEDPVKIEKDLMDLVPHSQWMDFGMRMITHGRSVCPARKPRCHECVLLTDCPLGQREISAGAGHEEVTSPRSRKKSRVRKKAAMRSGSAGSRAGH